MASSTSATSSVERARDLVQQEQRRLHRKSSHDRDSLLLASGEPVRIFVALVGEAETLEQLLPPHLGFGRR